MQGPFPRKNNPRGNKEETDNLSDRLQIKGADISHVARKSKEKGVFPEGSPNLSSTEERVLDPGRKAKKSPLILLLLRNSFYPCFRMRSSDRGRVSEKSGKGLPILVWGP